MHDELALLVATGKRADLLLVEGDPTREITATRAIGGVWNAGRRFDHEAYVATLLRTSDP